MKGHMILVTTKGDYKITRLSSVPDLDQLQAAVKGHIELVPFFNKFMGYRCVAFCNEEGKLKNLPVNTKAQTLWASSLNRACINEDTLVGDVVIISGDDELLEAL